MGPQEVMKSSHSLPSTGVRDQSHAYLEVITPPGQRAVFKIHPSPYVLEKDRTLIGRHRKTVDVHLDAGSEQKILSRTHAAIVKRRLHPADPRKVMWVIEDLESTNGLFVDHVKVKEARLEDSSVIHFGGGPQIALGSYVEWPSKIALRFRIGQAQSTPNDSTEKSEGSRYRKERNEESRSKLKSPQPNNDRREPFKPMENGTPRKKILEKATSSGSPEELSKSNERLRVLAEVASHTPEPSRKRSRTKRNEEPRMPSPTSPQRRIKVTSVSDASPVKSEQKQDGQAPQTTYCSAEANAGSPVSAADSTTASNQPRALASPMSSVLPRTKTATSQKVLPTAPLTKQSTLSMESKESKAQEETERMMKGLKTDLSCSLCSGLLLNPAILPCSHGYCLSCISQALEKDPYCPICRIRNQAPPIRSMHLERLLSRIVDTPGLLTADEREQWQKRVQAEEEVTVRQEAVILGTEDLDTSDEEEEEDDKKVENLCDNCMEQGHKASKCPHRTIYSDEEDPVSD